MDKLAGTGWRLIVDGRHICSQDVEAVSAASSLDITKFVIGGEGFAEVDGIVSQWFDRYECHVALVRPDPYVYGVSANLEQLLGQVRQLNRTLRHPWVSL